MFQRAASTARALLMLFVLLAPLATLAASAQEATPVSATAVVADDLTNPRGVTWGADGAMFIALSGTGGEAPGPEGSPFSGGETAAVAVVRDGTVTTLADGLPSSVWRDIDWVWGVMDVAILGEQLYSLNGGGGAIHGNPDTPSGVYRINADGSTALVADLGAWVDDNPVANPPPEGVPNNGSFFAMFPVGDALWVSESVNGQILQVTVDGQITRIADLSAGHLVPTGLAAAPGGGAYVGYLTAAPYVEGSAKIAHVSADGAVEDVWTGLTTVTGVAVGPDGTLYAAEMSSETTEAEPFLTEDSGRILRRSPSGEVTDVVTGLDAPVSVRVGPDGALYVSTPAFGADAGKGKILRIDAQPG